MQLSRSKSERNGATCIAAAAAATIGTIFDADLSFRQLQFRI